MEKYVKKLGLISIVSSIILLIIGFLMSVYTLTFMTSIILVFGVALIISGTIHCFSYFMLQENERLYSFELAQSVIYLLLGFVVIMNNQNIAQILPILVGIWVATEGIFKLQFALNIRGNRNTEWGIMFLFSLITIAIGFGIIFNPIRSFEIALKISGIIIIITQLFNIYDIFYIYFQYKDEKKKTKKKKIKEQ